MAATGGESIAEIKERLTKTRENLQKSIDAYAVILVLLASITYIGFLQPPGSFDEGGLIGTSSRLRSFVYCNSSSFFFSIIDLLLCVSGNPDLKLEETNDGHKLARPVVHTLIKLLGVNLLFVVSLTCCMGAYVSAGTVVQKLNIADQETMLISSIIGSSLYVVFILLLLFLFTIPTLQFFSTASTCCDVGSHSRCLSWKNQEKAAEQQKSEQSDGASSSNTNSSGEAPGTGSCSCKITDKNPETSEMHDHNKAWKNPCEILERYLKKLDDKLLGRNGTTPSESSQGGNLSGPPPISQEKEGEQQNRKESDGASSSNANSRGKAIASSSCKTTDKKNAAMIEMPERSKVLTIREREV